MANFVLLYSGGGMAESPEEQAATMQAWGAWFGRLGEHLVDGGNPFTTAAKHLDAKGAIHDGPAGALATGYSILKAESLAAAAELAKGCPVLQGDGQITVYEISPTM